VKKSERSGEIKIKIKRKIKIKSSFIPSLHDVAVSSHHAKP